MENATKALMVVATVLMAIIIVSLGIFVYNKSSISKSSNLDAMEITAWNQKFLIYEGKQKGTGVKNLLKDASLANEELYKDDSNIKYCVCICSKSERILQHYKVGSEMRKGLDRSREYGVRYPTNIKDIANHIKAKESYYISFNYNDLTGRINEIWINDSYAQ